MAMGPVQLLVLGFEDPKFTGEILDELKRLREHDIVRVVDAMVVLRNEDGTVEATHFSDLTTEEAQQFGAVVGALMGLGAAGEEGAVAGAEIGAAAAADGELLDEDMWALADVIPVGQVCAVALFEHRWAIPLRDAIARAGGFTLADEWIHPKDLIAAGLAAAAE